MVEVEITRTLDRYVEAAVLRFIKFSSDRLESITCPHTETLEDGRSLLKAGGCGGCPWMGIQYEAQLKAKAKMVLSTLRNLGAIEGLFTEVLASPEILNYRGRCQIKCDGRQAGFFAAHSRVLVDVENCIVMNERLAKQYSQFRQRLPDPGLVPDGKAWTFYYLDDEMTGPAQPELPRPFFQANRKANLLMKDWLRARLRTGPKTKGVLELFCGAGNFTEVLADYAPVWAFDVDKQALLSFKQTKNVIVRDADLFDFQTTRRICLETSKQIDTLFLDPPRTGYLKLRECVDALGPGLTQIIYVSCSLQSFNRDAHWLKKMGWKLSALQPLDQFPHTPHVELLSVFRRV